MPLPELIEAEGFFKDAAWDTMVDLALGLLFAKLPFLNIFLIRDAVRWVVFNYADELFTLFTDLVNVAYVVLKNKSLQTKFVEFNLRLKNIALQKGSESPEYKEARRVHQQEFAAKVRSNLVRAA
jgi:hypothetical protein